MLEEDKVAKMWSRYRVLIHESAEKQETFFYLFSWKEMNGSLLHIISNW